MAQRFVKSVSEIAAEYDKKVVVFDQLLYRWFLGIKDSKKETG